METLERFNMLRMLEVGERASHGFDTPEIDRLYREGLFGQPFVYVATSVGLVCVKEEHEPE